MSLARHCSPVIGTLLLLGLSACNSGNGYSGAQNTIAVTPSASGTIKAVSGGSRALSLAFISSDSQPITDLRVTSGLSPLPAGWRGPATFSCTTVTTGSGCVLNLTFAPTSAGSGTVTIDYSYINSAGTSHTGSMAIPYASTSNDNIAGTVSPTGQINAMVGGGAQAVTVTFDTDDGNPASALSLTTDLATLPAGWSSTDHSFSCASVSSGNGCQLPLSYVPAAVGSGTLTLNFSYTDNSGTAKTGTVAIAYASTSNNNVVGTIAPSGQVNAVVGGGTQAVTLTFTTDDGNPATALSVTSGLSSLPSGWISTVSSLTCASVSTGNGCQLHLTYAPSAVSSGTLHLTYGYMDNAGAAKTGTSDIPYAATVHDNVAGTASPTGQINAVVGAGSQTVTVTFDTDDGNVATALALTTALNSLPSGWSSSAHSFACANVSTGSGCQLSLVYTPTVGGSGTLALNFGYTDNAGTAKTGTVNIPYAATVHDNVVGTASPSGAIDLLVNATQNVSVTFTTDDGKVATAFSVTSGLSSLPTGWSSGATSLACASVSTGTGCQVNLTYAPTAVGSGTLTLNYGYTDNAGSAKTGSVDVPYAATIHNNVVATAAPSGTISPAIGGSQVVTVTFTTDDGNPATSLSVTSGLSTLPADWTSGASTFTCSSVSTGTGCQLSLTYAPTAAASGTLTLNFGYTDNAGTAKTGSIGIVYSAVSQHAYVVDNSSGVYVCSINGDGTLSGCATTGNGYTSPISIVFNGSYAYVSDFYANQVYVCVVAADGTLSGCTGSGSGLTSPARLSIQGSTLYAANANNPGGITYCTISAVDGTLSNCTGTASSLGQNVGSIALDGSYAYAAQWVGSVYVCGVGVGGALSSCAATASGVNSAFEITLSGSTAYIADATDGLATCTIDGAGGLSSCAVTAIGSSLEVMAFAPNGTNGYLIGQNFNTFSSDVYLCTINAGSVSNCAVSDGGVTFNNPWDVVIH